MAEALQITNRGQGYLDGLRDKGISTGNQSKDVDEQLRYSLLIILEDGPLTQNTFRQLIFGKETGPFDRIGERAAAGKILDQLHRMGFIEFTDIEV